MVYTTGQMSNGSGKDTQELHKQQHRSMWFCFILYAYIIASYEEMAARDYLYRYAGAKITRML